MGVIYRARDIRLRRPVALRIVAADLAADPVTRARLNRESTALAALDHPNVPPIYEAAEANGRIFIASRWVEGPNLGELAQEQGPLDPVRAVRIVNQAAYALHAAHALGIMHRNVKPSTILVTSADHAYLTDFGLARHDADMTGLTSQDELFESYDYVAPEYIDGRQIDGRVDIYGLGCALYEALTAEVPFPKAGPAAKMYAHLSTAPPSVRAQRPDLPEQLDAVVTRAMAKDPADRQQTPEQFAVEAASAVGLSVPPWAGLEAGAAAPARRRTVDPTLAPAPEQARDGDGPPPVSPGADGDGHSPLSPLSDGHRQPVARPGADGARPRPPAPAVADGDGHPAAVAGPTPAEAAPRLGDSDYYEPVFYRQPRRRPRRRLLLWVVLVLLFIAAPVALALALAGNSSAATLAGGRAPAAISRRVQPARATPIFSGRSSIRTGSAPSKDS